MKIYFYINPETKYDWLNFSQGSKNTKWIIVFNFTRIKINHILRLNKRRFNKIFGDVV